MRQFSGDRIVALSFAALLLIGSAGATLYSIQERIDAEVQLSNATEELGQIQSRAAAQPSKALPPGKTEAPPSAFFAAPSRTLAAAQLQSYLAGILRAARATLSSSTAEPALHEDTADMIRSQIVADIDSSALQDFLYKLEAGTPYIFVSSLLAQPNNQKTGTEGQTLRITVSVRANWRLGT